MTWLRRLTPLVILLTATITLSPVDARAQEASDLERSDAEDRPSHGMVIRGSLLGGLALSGGVAAIGLGISGGQTGCYEGGCATAGMAALAWPIGSAIGVGIVMRRGGFRVSSGRLAAASLLGVGLGVLAMVAVDRWLADVGSHGPSDETYVLAAVTAHVATMALIGPSAGKRGGAIHPSVTLHPALVHGRVGLGGRLNFW